MDVNIPILYSLYIWLKFWSQTLLYVKNIQSHKQELYVGMFDLWRQIDFFYRWHSKASQKSHA